MSLNSRDSLFNKYRKRFREWCAESTSHGIPRIIGGRNNFIRALWVLFFLAGSGYCSYLVIKTIIDFFKYETNVSVYRQQQLPATFPAVTICNMNPFNEKYSTGFLEVYTNLTYWDCVQVQVNSTSRCTEVYNETLKRIEQYKNCFSRIQSPQTACNNSIHDREKYFADYLKCFFPCDLQFHLETIWRLQETEYKFKKYCLTPIENVTSQCEDIRLNLSTNYIEILEYDNVDLNQCLFHGDCSPYKVFDLSRQYVSCLTRTNANITDVPRSIYDNDCSGILLGFTELYGNLTDYDKHMKRVYANKIKNENLTMTNLGFSLGRDMLVSCKFNNKICTANNFTQRWINSYGFCYTFNDNDTKTYLNAAQNGQNYGLEMEIVANPADYEIKYTRKYGLRLMVHNQSSLPFTINKGIDIPTGYEVYVGVERTFTIKQEEPYSDCQKDLQTDNPYGKILFKYFNQLNVRYYDQEFCLYLCFQEKLIKKCGCSDIDVPTIDNVDYCQLRNVSNHVKCMEKFKEDFFSQDFNMLCESACPQPCETIDYNLKISQGRFPNLNYLKFLSKIKTRLIPADEDEDTLRDFRRESFLKLIVNYDNFYYTVIEEKPSSTTEKLLADIGGSLGLFIGVSFLSLVEVIELLADFVVIYWKHGKEKEENEQKRANNPYWIDLSKKGGEAYTSPIRSRLNNNFY